MNGKQLGLVLILVFIFGIYAVAFDVRIVEAQEFVEISIMPDGSVSPADPANFTRTNDNLYELTGNINGSIAVYRSDMTIDGNGFTLRGPGDGTRVGIYVQNGEFITIKNMTIIGFRQGISLTGSNFTVLNNEIVDNWIGIAPAYGSNNITGNTITGSRNQSIWLMYTWYDMISGNNIAHNELGIYIQGSAFSHIFQNNITDTENWHGIRIYVGAHDLRIYENNITGNSWSGINIDGDSKNNTIYGNTIAKNGENGIDFFDNSSNNTVYENNITLNEKFGVEIRALGLGVSPNNTFYHNNFVDNFVGQAINYNSSNTVWDDGYPSGGNYWSDYDGTDGDDDGIGDTPYLVPSTYLDDSEDRYPLKTEYSTVTKTPTTLTCDVSPSPITILDSVTVSGEVTPPLEGVAVTLTYKKPDGSTFIITVMTAPDGSYRNVYTPDTAGLWSVKASWEGDATYAASESDWTPFTVNKITTTISCSVSPAEISATHAVTVSGTITPALEGKTVTLRYQKPDGSTLTRTVTTASDGSYSDEYTPDKTGPWKVSASGVGDAVYDEASSAIQSFTVKKSGCLIATATFESELSPEVQFLRGFRDNTVLSTFAGSNFMTVFNTFYYSFSPSVASTISDHGALRGAMKIILYPLVGILHLSSSVFSLFSFSAEVGVVMAGFVASSLIATVYVVPWILLLGFLKKFKPSPKIIRSTGLVWAGSLIMIALAEATKSSSLMMPSTGAFVLLTMGLITLVAVRWIPPIIGKLQIYNSKH